MSGTARRAERKCPEAHTAGAWGRAPGSCPGGELPPANHTGHDNPRRHRQESTRTCPKGREQLPSEACWGRSVSLHTAPVPHAIPDHPRAKTAAARGVRQNQDWSNGRTTTYRRHPVKRAVSRHTGAGHARAPAKGPPPPWEPEWAVLLTMSTHACFPSMKPFGMEFGVRISYLRKKEKAGQSSPLLGFPAAWDAWLPTGQHTQDSLHGVSQGRQTFSKSHPALSLGSATQKAFTRSRKWMESHTGLFQSKTSFRLGSPTANGPVSASAPFPRGAAGASNKWDGPGNRGLHHASNRP